MAAESEWYLLVLEDIPTPLLPLEVLQIEAQMENVERIPSLVPKVQRPLPPQLAFTASSTLITTPLPVPPSPPSPNSTTPLAPSPSTVGYGSGSGGAAEEEGGDDGLVRRETWRVKGEKWAQEREEYGCRVG